MYVVSLRKRIRCPVLLLVVCTKAKVARWARKAIYLGGQSRVVPWVVAPDDVPEITDHERAKCDPELAVLSAMSHGHDRNVELATKIASAARAACDHLDIDKSTFYFDLIASSLSEEAQRACPTMLIPGYEYQTAFARRFFDEGESKGKAEGKAEGQSLLLLKLLEMRFGALPPAMRARISGSSAVEIDRMAESLLTATSLNDIVCGVE